MHKDSRETSLHTFCSPFERGVFFRFAVSIDFIYFNNDISTDECWIIFFFNFNGQLKVLGPAYTAYVYSEDYLNLSIKLELIF